MYTTAALLVFENVVKLFRKMWKLENEKEERRWSEGLNPESDSQCSKSILNAKVTTAHWGA